MRVGTVAVFGSRSKISLLFSFSDRCAHGKRWNNANEIALDRNESPRKRKLIARIVARPSSFAVKRNFGPSPDLRNVRIDESLSIVSATTLDTYLHTVPCSGRSLESERHAVSIRLNVEPALRDRPEQRDIARLAIASSSITIRQPLLRDIDGSRSRHSNRRFE